MVERSARDAFLNVPELLAETFWHCLSSDRYIIPKPRDAPLLLTRVCRTWRQVAFTSPNLWFRISFYARLRDDDSVDAEVRALTRWLDLSGSLPISLYLCLPYEGDKILHLTRAILPYSHRWHDLRVDGPAADLVPVTELVGDQTPLLRKLRLRVLGQHGFGDTRDVGVPFRSPRLMIKTAAAPNLSALCVDGLTAAHIAGVELNGLPKSLEILELICANLGAFPPLTSNTKTKYLVLHYVWSSGLLEALPAIFPQLEWLRVHQWIDSPQPALSSRIAILRLRILIFRTGINQMVYPLDFLVLPSLEMLEVYHDSVVRLHGLWPALTELMRRSRSPLKKLLCFDKWVSAEELRIFLAEAPALRLLGLYGASSSDEVIQHLVLADTSQLCPQITEIYLQKSGGYEHEVVVDLILSRRRRTSQTEAGEYAILERCHLNSKILEKLVVIPSIIDCISEGLELSSDKHLAQVSSRYLDPHLIGE